MSIATCLAKLVAAKRITQKAADDALALHEGVQGRLYPAMGPASADAAAALEAARVMAQAAKERKLEAAQQAIRQRQLLDRMEGHAKGKTAGLFGAMVRDIYDDPDVPSGERINVESLSDGVAQELMAKGRALVEGYASKLGGLVKDTESIWNVVREGYGVDTGDALAKQAWTGWDAAVKHATDRVRRGGKRLSVLDDWRFMQFWETRRIREHSQAEFVEDLMREVRAGTLRVMDKQGQGEAGAAAVPGIIANAYDDIFHSRGAGVGGFSNQLRVFRFDDPEAYIRLMKKYGPGDGGLYNAFMGHIGGMAREIAWVEVFGPNYETNFKKLLETAREDDTLRHSAKIKPGMSRAGKIGAKAKAGIKRLSITRNVTSPAAAQRTFDYLTGRLGLVESEMMAGIFGGLRSLSTAARLGSAFVSAVPGDSVTATLAANEVGIAPTAVLARLARDIAGDKAYGRELAAQMNLSSAAIMDAALGAKRFEDEVVGENFAGRLAEFVIRVQGLQAWTEGLKRAFSMEMMGLIARQADHAFERLDPSFQRFLRRYSFSPADWDALRATPQIEAEGARFFDIAAVENRRLGDRLTSAIVDERRFAVIEPDARIKQLTTGGGARGTLWGELARSGFMFKSFSMSILTTHLMRAVTQGPWHQRAWRVASYFTLMTMAGAASQQASSLITGKDPLAMNTPQFWGGAMLRGGGLGFYGDFLYSARTRGEAGVYEAVAGPVLGTGIEAFARAAQGSLKGRDLARYLKAFTPGSTLWYTRLATDRVIFDQLQSLVDPDYRRSFDRYEKRIRKEFGQRFWWAPGEMAPARAPDLSQAMGG